MGEWKPISSAPKDGTSVLVVDINASTPEAMEAHWAQHDAWGGEPTWLCGKTWPPFWKMTPRVARAYGEIVGEVMSPTHWMPIPPPPPKD